MVSKDSNIVLVVDDDPGMLKAVQRLLPLHAYEPILFVRSGIQQTTLTSKRQLASSSTSTCRMDQGSS